VNVLLLGPQGSGKGTQAKRIEAEYGLPHIATGDMLRQAMAEGSELGQRVKPIYDSGRLVPDDLMIDLIRERLEQPDTADGFVLDGFPRTSAHADALDTMLSEIGRDLSIVFEFQLPDDIATERLLKRAELEGRVDDTPEVIARRLGLYHDRTEPLVEHYRAQGNLVGIHGNRSVNEVFAEVQRALDQAAAHSS
jgi:adenylate kinase